MWMNDFIKTINVKGWFSESGVSDDVVVSSRVRIARNLADFPFPGVMSVDDEKEVEKRVVGIFKRIKHGDRFRIIRLKELNPIERRILLERNFITQEFLLAKDKTAIINDEETLSVMINEEDHLRIASIRAGLNLKGAYEEVNALDNELEMYLHYSVSMEWGYLNSSLNNIGTAMRGSVMFHLPALAMTSLLDRVLKSVNQVGISVKGFFGDDEGSLGDMYQFSNQVTLGISEEEILEKLEGVAYQLVNYERKAREELLDRKRIDIEDKILRAYGILNYCKLISVKEAVELLTLIRLGVCLNIIKGVKLQTVNRLLFLSQKSSVQRILNETFGEDFDSHQVDYMRAKIIRETLSKTETMEGNDV